MNGTETGADHRGHRPADYVPRRGQAQRLIIPELEPTDEAWWQFLTARPHPWRRQLWVKGRKLPAAVVWSDWRVNGGTAQEIAGNWDLPVAAAEEALRYGETHQYLLRMEAEEEKLRLAETDVDITPLTERGEPRRGRDESHPYGAGGQNVGANLCVRPSEFVFALLVRALHDAAA